ncbi:MAG: MerR family transcriptional regulator [Thermodesulfobacteriota bacterium]
MVKDNTSNRLKISKLSSLSGVPIPTIRFYVQEGLLPQPVKTGKTMAYYDPACVERIKLIKQLQKERFLPIEVIRRLIEAGEVSQEESELGQVLTKSGPSGDQAAAVPKSRIVEHTGYSSEKIQRLSKAGLIAPQPGDDGPFFDALDVELIGLAKKEEEAGIPLDFTMVSFQMYHEAVARVVSENTRRVLFYILDDMPIQNIPVALKAIEESLDRLVLLVRQKSVREVNKLAMRGLHEMSRALAAMVFLPVQGRHLPKSAPDDEFERVLYYFCQGEYPAVLNLVLIPEHLREPRRYVSARILAHLMMNNTKDAIRLSESLPGYPGLNLVENCLTALAHVQAATSSSGIIMPLQHLKKARPFLQAGEATQRGPKLIVALVKYVCGSIYLALPEILGFGERGASMLAQVSRLLRAGKFGQRRLPRWLAATLDEEILPALETRVNDLLSRRYLAIFDGAGGSP